MITPDERERQCENEYQDGVGSPEGPLMRLPARLLAALPRVRLLSSRERDVFARLSAGPSNRELARELSIQERTAKFHVASILEKLGLDSRIQAGLLASVYRAEDCPNGQ